MQVTQLKVNSERICARTLYNNESYTLIATYYANNMLRMQLRNAYNEQLICVVSELGVRVVHNELSATLLLPALTCVRELVQQHFKYICARFTHLLRNEYKHNVIHCSRKSIITLVCKHTEQVHVIELIHNTQHLSEYKQELAHIIRTLSYTL